MASLLEWSGYGSGYGYGSWYGYGYGSWYGYGYGYGSWYGDGSGDGYGHGCGDGYGDGSGDGYGDGCGCGYGDGYGYGDTEGSGSGSGSGEAVLQIGDYDIELNRTFAIAKIGCQVKTINEWISCWRAVAAENGVDISPDDEKAIVQLLAEFPSPSGS